MGTHDDARLAAEAEVPGMGEALALDVADDPVMCWLFGEEPPPPMRCTEPWFTSEGRRHMGHGHLHAIDGTSGAPCSDPPPQWNTRVLDLLRIAPLMAPGIGMRTPSDMRSPGRMENGHAAQPKDHHHQGLLGTRPDRQALASAPR